MALELRQQLKLTQQLIMTPQLQMAIKLLQLSRLELLETIQQELYHVSSREKLSLLLGLLEREGAERTMVFVNTRHGARRIVVAQSQEFVLGLSVAYGQDLHQGSLTA